MATLVHMLSMKGKERREEEVERGKGERKRENREGNREKGRKEGRRKGENGEREPTSQKRKSTRSFPYAIICLQVALHSGLRSPTLGLSRLHSEGLEYSCPQTRHSNQGP